MNSLQITNDAFSKTEKDRTEQSLWNKLFICCRVSFVTFSCCVTIVVLSLVCINIDSFGQYNLVTGNTPPKIIFLLFSRNENQGKLRVRFNLQVGNPWTNLTEIWPTYCQIVLLKNRVCECWFLFTFLSQSIFSQIVLMICHPWLQLLIAHKRTNASDKNLRHGFLVKRVIRTERDLNWLLPFIFDWPGLKFTVTPPFTKSFSFPNRVNILIF